MINLNNLKEYIELELGKNVKKVYNYSINKLIDVRFLYKNDKKWIYTHSISLYKYKNWLRRKKLLKLMKC